MRYLPPRREAPWADEAPDGVESAAPVDQPCRYAARPLAARV